MLTGFLTFLDVIVIGLCCISLLLTFGSLRRALKLARVGKFAMQQRTFSRNWAKTGLGIHFLPHFCTVQLSLPLHRFPHFILHPSFLSVLFQLLYLISLSTILLSPLSFSSHSSSPLLPCRRQWEVSTEMSSSFPSAGGTAVPSSLCGTSSMLSVTWW